LGSKFCNECGAALHLQPCPQCGSINDITLTADCSRCSAALPPQPELPAVLMAESIDRAAAEPPAALYLHAAERAPVSAAELAFDTSSVRVLPQPLLQRPLALLVGAALLIAAAAVAAAYLLVQQHEEPSADQSPVAAESSVAPTSGRAAGSVLPVSRSAATDLLEPPSAEPLPTPPLSSAASQAMSAVQPSAAAVAAITASPAASAAGRMAVFKGSSTNLKQTWPTAREATEIVQAAEAAQLQLQLRSRARLDAGVGLDLPLPNLGPCTQAVAALGLCAAPDKQIPPPVKATP
jgi:hypothetical protein